MKLTEVFKETVPQALARRAVNSSLGVVALLPECEEVLGEAHCNRGSNTEGTQAILYLSF